MLRGSRSQIGYRKDRKMRTVGLIVFIVLVALVGIVYVGGTCEVGGKRVFEHIDHALGTNFFMGCYYKLMFALTREESTEKDEWTTVHQDWEKVLKHTVE